MKKRQLECGRRVFGWDEGPIPRWDDFGRRDYLRVPICYFFFVGWWALSLGLHVDLASPNLEIHIPFGFIRIGWCKWKLHDDGTICG